MTVTNVPPVELIRALVDAALAEDVGTGDVTSQATIDSASRGEAVILAREPGVIAGLPVAREVFHRVDPKLVFEADVEDGDRLAKDTVVARIRGASRSLLTAERTALNFLQHLSGIATAAATAVALLEGTGVRLLDTRKTVPGMRILAKYAVRCGGGENHRMGLYDMILVKDNHVTAAGGVMKAVKRSRSAFPDLPLEVEVTTLEELDQALESHPDRILLDNFDVPGVKAAVERVSGWQRETGVAAPEIELSGGITHETIREFAMQGVDFISSGALTHSVRALDLSLDLSIERGTP